MVMTIRLWQGTFYQTDFSFFSRCHIHDVYNMVNPRRFTLSEVLNMALIPDGNISEDEDDQVPSDDENDKLWTGQQSS